jgi:hypothetical protein
MTREMWDQASLETLSRRDLQRVAKELNVRANNKSSDMVSAILEKLGGHKYHHTNPLANDLFHCEAETSCLKSNSPGSVAPAGHIEGKFGAKIAHACLF